MDAMVETQERNRAVQRMLSVLEEEFPGYHVHGDSLVEAAVAVTAVLGAVGAHALLGGGEQRLQKMLRMASTNADEFARRAANVIKDRKSRMS